MHFSYKVLMSCSCFQRLGAATECPFFGCKFIIRVKITWRPGRASDFAGDELAKWVTAVEITCLDILI